MDLNGKAKVAQAPVDDPAEHVIRSLIVLFVLTCGTVGAAVTAIVRDSSDWLIASTVGAASAMAALLLYKFVAAIVFVVRGSGLDIVDEAVDVVVDQIHDLHKKHEHAQEPAHAASAAPQPESAPGMDAKSMRERFARAARAASAGQRK